jgi:hypothetical protein
MKELDGVWIVVWVGIDAKLIAECQLMAFELLKCLCVGFQAVCWKSVVGG